MPKKPPPEFDDEQLRDHRVVQEWKEKTGFDDMPLLTLMDKFLQAYRKDAAKKYKAVVKAAKKAKLPIPEPPPEPKNPKIDEPTFSALVKKLKLDVPDLAALFKAANTSRSGLISFGEFVNITGTLKNKDAPPEDKLSLVFRMYDRDNSGALEASEVSLLLEAGLSSNGDGAPEAARQQKIEQVLSEVGMAPRSAQDGDRMPGRKRADKDDFVKALSNKSVVRVLTPAGDQEAVAGKLYADQVFEATVMKQPSKLCTIL